MKLAITHTKKVPGQEDYSSEGFGATIEVEVPDDQSQDATVVQQPTDDPGRFAVTGEEADRHVFKVPSLRNVYKTGPYFHDGSIDSVEAAIRIMGEHQLGRTLSDEQVHSIAAFLKSLTGGINPVYIAKPVMPASGPDTPPPNPS